MPDLLFEIGTEEIPASYIGPALQQMDEKFSRKMAELRVAHGEIKTMGTPRRLTLIVRDLAAKQADVREELLGPSVKAGLDTNGKMTKAAEGFARSKGADPSLLQVVNTPKGDYLMLVREVAGQQTMTLLPDILQQMLLELSFPKSMRWGSNHHAFARPIQWLTVLLDDEVIPLAHEGICAGKNSRGHRFLANDWFAVDGVENYEQQLAGRKVIVDQKQRRQMVIEEIRQAVQQAPQLAGGKVAIDEQLVDTVTNLVEKPFGICGTFDEKFLQVPAEVLITSMREHQKYFPVVDADNRLMPGFIAVNNTAVNNQDVTRKGHQRVLRARLEDALFFFNSDRETRLIDRVAALDGIIFQAKLGTMAAKKDRLVKLVHLLADKLAPELTEDGCRAATLCKADLLTDMVGEFPTLQGVMGAAYARHDGEKEVVANAIEEHYMPKRAGADIPPSELGALLGLADRFDTLVGCFGIGQVPTGTADPFGLRRISLAILNIIEKKNYRLSLREVCHKALALYGDKVDGSQETVEKVVGFIQGRFVNDRVARGMASGAVDAVVSVGFDDVTDCLKRIAAVAAIGEKAEFALLASSFKRIRNIIKENETTDVKPQLLSEDAEKRLYDLLGEVRTAVEARVSEGNYEDALEGLLRMKEPVDLFFDKVMVMAEDAAVRTNRLNLLTAFAALVLKVGDISRLQEA
jgi:glycyl-tRNA synthetase beta chain